MIVIDTHIWVWWVHGDSNLSSSYREVLQRHVEGGIGVCAISCWEVATLESRGRLSLSHPISQWMDVALAIKGVKLLELTPEIAIDSTRLPGEFHRDPADQIIVATARVNSASLLTLDTKIRGYEHVRLADLDENS